MHESLKGLDEAKLKDAVGSTMTDSDVAAFMGRRDKLLAGVDSGKIALL